MTVVVDYAARVESHMGQKLDEYDGTLERQGGWLLPLKQPNALVAQLAVQSFCK